MPCDVSDSEPFLRQAGIKAGLTKHHLDGPAYHRLFRSVRISGESALTPEALAGAALLVVPNAVVSHHSAARLLGGVAPEDPLVHLTVGAARHRRKRAGVVMHVQADPETVRRGSLRLTSPEQTFCDLADELGLVDLVVLGDSLVHRGSLTLDTLVDAAERKTTGATAAARRAAILVRERVESPMESRVRLMMAFAELPEPEVNLTVGSVDGTVTYRLDLSYRDLRFAIEYDGRQHAEDSAQWARDMARREWLDDHDWRLLVLRATDVYDTPWETIRRIAAVLSARGYYKPLPRAPTDLFRIHFPGRPWRAAVSR